MFFLFNKNDILEQRGIVFTISHRAHSIPRIKIHTVAEKTLQQREIDRLASKIHNSSPE